MIEAGGGLRFLHEALAFVDVQDPVPREHLEGNEPVQARVPRLVHGAHAPLAEDLDDLVVQQALTDHEASRL